MGFSLKVLYVRLVVNKLISPARYSTDAPYSSIKTHEGEQLA
jgi:hypothetical protein